MHRSRPFVTRASTRPFVSAARRQFATPQFGGKTILWSGAAAAGGVALSPLAFVEIGHDKSGNGEKTHEEAMLEVSRQELAEQVPKSLENSKKYRRGVYFFVEDYIIEPIATGLRFLHLVIIFVPVIVTIPAIWIGARNVDRDNERSGTLWWYGFLVGSMERAGAAFIKVRICNALLPQYNLTCVSWGNGPLLEQISSQPRCARSCPLFTLTPQRIHSRLRNAP